MFTHIVIGLDTQACFCMCIPCMYIMYTLVCCRTYCAGQHRCFRNQTSERASHSHPSTFMLGQRYRKELTQCSTGVVNRVPPPARLLERVVVLRCRKGEGLAISAVSLKVLEGHLCTILVYGPRRRVCQPHVFCPLLQGQLLLSTRSGPFPEG